MSQIREATHEEVQEWLALHNGVEQADNVSEAWVITGYITDCPGYSGPVGCILWSGSPSWICVFTRTDGAWKLEVDTCNLLESDPRGCFEEVVARITEIGGADDNLLEFITKETEADAIELFETGTLTIELDSKKYVLTLNVKEATDG